MLNPQNHIAADTWHFLGEPVQMCFLRLSCAFSIYTTGRLWAAVMQLCIWCSSVVLQTLFAFGIDLGIPKLLTVIIFPTEARILLGQSHSGDPQPMLLGAPLLTSLSPSQGLAMHQWNPSSQPGRTDQQQGMRPHAPRGNRDPSPLQ